MKSQELGTVKVGIDTCRFEPCRIIAGLLKLSHESIYKRLLPHLVAGVSRSVGNVEWGSATKAHEWENYPEMSSTITVLKSAET